MPAVGNQGGASASDSDRQGYLKGGVVVTGKILSIIWDVGVVVWDEVQTCIAQQMPRPVNPDWF